jgi:hypothetical protein
MPMIRPKAPGDAAPAIDLVDGQELAELLKRDELRVRTVMVEKVVVDGEWFRGFEGFFTFQLKNQARVKASRFHHVIRWNVENSLYTGVSGQDDLLING